MSQTTTITMHNKNWEAIQEVLTAAAENWTPEDEGPSREDYYAFSWYIRMAVEGD